MKKHYKYIEKKQILKACKKARGNRAEAARLLGISRPTLIRRIREFKISKLIPVAKIGGKRKPIEENTVKKIIERCNDCPMEQADLYGPDTFCKITKRVTFSSKINSDCPYLGKSIILKWPLK